MARLVVGVAGAAAGFMIGGPAGAQWGFMAGSMVGGLLESPQRVQGPRLDDLKAPAASYGSPIPYVIGSPRVAGVVAWASDKREIATTEEVGGKGGPGVEQTTYTYEIDVLYLLSINPAAGVRRIWANGELIWTIADDADAESLIASAQTERWRAIRVYSGSANQLPDPTYEAAVGVGNAPAYRGRCSVFIEGLQLGGSGQLPVLTFEVAREFGGSGATEDTMGTLEATYRYGTGGLHVAPDGSVTLHVKRWTPSSPGSTVDVHRFGADGTQGIVSTYAVEGGDSVDSMGSSDVSCLVTRVGGTFIRQDYAVYLDSGVPALEFSIDTSATAYRYAYRDGVMYWALSESDPTTIYRIDPAGNITQQATEYGMQSVVCDGETVYAMRRGGGVIDTFDADTLAPGAAIAVPFVDQRAVLMLDESAQLHLVIGPHLYAYRGGWELIADDLSVTASRTQETSLDRFALLGGTVYRYALPDSNIGAGSLYRARMSRSLSPEPLSDVVSRLCLRTGLLSAGDIDVTALADDRVRAMAVSQVTTTRNVIETLMSAYLFEAVEDDKIRFIKRGGASVATIPYEDLGASSGEPVEPLPLRRVNDIEMPAQITVRYSNVANDYQDGSESGDRLVTQSTRTDVVELPLGMTPQEAKRLADARTMDVAAAMLSIGPIALTRAYSHLQPTDVVTLTGPTGSTYRARLTRCTDSQGVRTFEAVLDDASVINSAALTDEGYTSTSLVRSIGDTDLELLDIPILRDADNDPGYYAAMRGNGRWRGAVLFESIDDVTYTEDAQVRHSAVMGVTTTALGAWTGGHVFDEINAVTVDMGDGELSSVIRYAILTGIANTILIGNEIIRFRTATLVSPGVYTLTGLLRGQRGTEWAMGSHSVGERVVLLGTAGTVRVQRQAGELGATYHHRAVTVGRSLSSAETVSITPQGIGLKPFAPVDVRATRGSSGGASITWRRRSRLSSRLLATTGTPLGESSESYEVDIYSDGTFTTVLRTLSATAEAVTYTYDQQVSDFGSPQSTIYCRVYQRSAVVGRGYAADSTVVVGGSSLLFVPDTANPRPIIHLSAGPHFLASREGTSGGRALGLYTYSEGESTLNLLTAVGASAATPYLPDMALTASDPATGAFVMLLRAQGNPSELRRLMYGVLPGSCLAASPAFMPDTPPLAIWWTGAEFRALLVDGHVWSSLTGATWTDEGSSSGAPTPTSDVSGGYIVNVGGVLAMKCEDAVYTCADTDGMAWTAATGDVASLPTGVYSDHFALTGIASNGARAVLIGMGRKPADSTDYGLVYTSTDGAEWSLDVEAVFGTSAYRHDARVNGGLFAFGGDFFCDLYPLAGGTTAHDILEVHDFGDAALTFAEFEASRGKPGSAGILAIGRYAIDTPYYTTDLATRVDLTWNEP